MSRDTVSILKRHLNEKDHSVLLNIIKNHLYLDMYEGVARNQAQIEITAGGMIGEARREGKHNFTVIVLFFSIVTASYDFQTTKLKYFTDCWKSLTYSVSFRQKKMKMAMEAQMAINQRRRKPKRIRSFTRNLKLILMLHLVIECLYQSC